MAPWSTAAIFDQFQTRTSICVHVREKESGRKREEREEREKERERERENFVHATLMMFFFSSSLKTPEDHDGTLKLECQLCRGRVP